MTMLSRLKRDLTMADTARVPGGGRVDFFVDFEFKSRILQRVIEMLFHEAVRRMVAAFEDRARQLYGAPEPHPAGKPAV